MAKTEEKIHYDETKLPERLRGINSFVVIAVCAVLFWAGDAFGYPDGPNKLIPGPEVWGILEGSGHSLSQIAAGIAAGEMCDLGVKKPIPLKLKYITSFILALCFELGGSSFNSVIDIKDLSVICISPALLFLIHRWILRYEQRMVRDFLREETEKTDTKEVEIV